MLVGHLTLAMWRLPLRLPPSFLPLCAASRPSVRPVRLLHQPRLLLDLLRLLAHLWAQQWLPLRLSVPLPLRQKSSLQPCQPLHRLLLLHPLLP